MYIADGTVILASPNHMWVMPPVVNTSNQLIIDGTAINRSISAVINVYDNAQVNIGSGSLNVPTHVFNIPVGNVYIELVLNSGTLSYDYVISAMLYENGVAPSHPTITNTINITPTILATAPRLHPTFTAKEPDIQPIQKVPMLNTQGTIKILGRNSVSVHSGSAVQFYNLRGTVSESGVPRTNTLMRLYDRSTGEMMAETFSDGVGDWIFTSVFLILTSRYYVVAFDDITTPVKQAVIHDFLIPRPV